MAYKVLSSLTANNINSADLLKVKTDLLIIAVNKKHRQQVNSMHCNQIHNH